MAKAFLISAIHQSIETVDVHEDDDIRRLIGFDSITSDLVGDFDRLYFDEHCFTRESVERFQVDRLIPVAGRGVFVGRQGSSLSDASIGVEALRQRVAFQ